MTHIVRALGTNLAEFFSETASEPIIYPNHEAISMLDDCLGHTMHFLIGNAQKLDMEPVLLEVNPKGRSKAYEAIVKGEAMPQPGIPESLNVLIHELQGLGLNISLD